MRDIARYLSGERKDYPAIPASYFDTPTEEVLADFEQRARAHRKVELAAELPGLTLRGGVPAGGAATTIFRNWLDFLGQDARVLPPESVRK
jgi:homoserine O-succinyltransferase